MRSGTLKCRAATWALGFVVAFSLACSDSSNGGTEPDGSQADSDSDRPDRDIGFPDAPDRAADADVRADDVAADAVSDPDGSGDDADVADSEPDDIGPSDPPPGDGTDAEPDPNLALDVTSDPDTGCGPPTADDPLPAVTGLLVTPHFLEIHVSWLALLSPHVASYNLYMDGELTSVVPHDTTTDRVGDTILFLDSATEHTFWVTAVSTACLEGARSNERTTTSLKRFWLILGEGSAPAGGTGSFEVLITNSEPVTAVSFEVEDAPDWLTITDASHDGWSWTATDDGSNGSLAGTADSPLPPGENEVVGTVQVSVADGVDGVVRLTPSNVTVTGATDTVSTTDGRFVVEP